MKKRITLESILEGRIAQYGFLATLFQGEIEEHYLGELKKMKCPINTGNKNVDEGYRLFHSYLSTTWERTFEELQKDYLRTFLGSNTTAYAAAYPHESVYTSPERLIMQDARDAVLALYRAAGLDKSDLWKDGEDHIALELDFERLLCARALQSLREHDDPAFYRLMMEQYYFLLDHLLNWVPMLVDDMKKFAKTDFYQALAYLTLGFLEVDKEFLEEVLADELIEKSEVEA
jgi:TorA maturation chaperone TorD